MCPTDFGFLAIELYFPRYFIAQSDLEEADRCPGKYTRGLEQDALGFCSVQEDVNSLCLTVLSNLVHRVHLDLRNVGFLEVGTETLVDKSKSTKTVLMELFERCGNTDIEGVDVKNACFGGTAAVFHALNWLESSSWDGRLAIVIAADIALYGTPAARPTGGAGAMALLLGPNAPLVVDPGLRSHHVRHVYDFYKPDMNSEYPHVDGPLSLQCYQLALVQCYRGYKRKAQSRDMSIVANSSASSLTSKHSIDFLCFHSPYTKLVRKAFGWIVLEDIRAELGPHCSAVSDAVCHDEVNESAPSHVSNGVLTEKSECHASLLQSLAPLVRGSKLPAREVDAICSMVTADLFASKVEPGLVFAKNVGNMYTASLYSCLASLLLKVPESELRHRRILLYSYGSGSAAAMFSLVVHPTRSLSNVVCSLDKAHNPLFHRLFEERTRLTITQFEELLEERRKLHNAASFRPTYRPEGLFPGSYYLDHVDDQYRRHYKQTAE